MGAREVSSAQATAPDRAQSGQELYKKQQPLVWQVLPLGQPFQPSARAKRQRMPSVQAKWQRMPSAQAKRQRVPSARAKRRCAP